MIIADWMLAPKIHAVCFDKTDTPEAIARTLPHPPNLLQQVHGNVIVTLTSHNTTTLTADGSYTQAPNTVCAIRSADCLAIYLASSSQDEIALLHGGWRGLSQNIIQAGVAQFHSPAAHLHAHLGPAISAPHYEVGTEVYDAFCGHNPELNGAFQASRPGHYYLDLYQIARCQLAQCGITHITGGHYCTFRDRERLHSFRRDGAQAGRLLHCLWIENC